MHCMDSSGHGGIEAYESGFKLVCPGLRWNQTILLLYEYCNKIKYDIYKIIH